MNLPGYVILFQSSQTIKSCILQILKCIVDEYAKLLTFVFQKNIGKITMKVIQIYVDKEQTSLWLCSVVLYTDLYLYLNIKDIYFSVKKFVSSCLINMGFLMYISQSNFCLFQYFTHLPQVPDSRIGRYAGSVALADYCPYIQVRIHLLSHIESCHG